MGGIYYKIWSCSNCNYTTSSVGGPFRVDPKVGTPKAKIEYRWCDDYLAIQRTFTGKAEAFVPGKEPNSPIKSWEFSSIEEFEKTLKELEQKKKSNLFFFLTKDAKRLKKYYESKSLCDQYTQENIAFYNNLNPKAKCLICGGTNVSKFRFDQDRHSCGGEFILRESGRVGSVNTLEVITYTSDGTPTSEIRDMK